MLKSLMAKLRMSWQRCWKQLVRPTMFIHHTIHAVCLKISATLEIQHSSNLNARAFMMLRMCKNIDRMHILKISGIKISLLSETFSPGNIKWVLMHAKV